MAIKWGKIRSTYFGMVNDSIYPLIETDDVYEDLSSHGEIWFELSNYVQRRRKGPLTVGKKQKSDWINERRKWW